MKLITLKEYFEWLSKQHDNVLAGKTLEQLGAQAQLSHCEQEHLKELRKIKSELEAKSTLAEAVASPNKWDIALVPFRSMPEYEWQAFWEKVLGG